MTGSHSSSALSSYLIAVRTALVAIGLLAAGCASGTSASAPTTAPRAQDHTPLSSRGLTATLSLDSAIVRTGRVLSARITVENNTGHALHASGCGGIFQVLLTSSTYHPGPVWPTCLEPITIPTGSSTYPMQVEARYNICGQGRDLPPCSGSETPALAPGRYDATTFELGDVVPLPSPIPVDVTG
jgi:hypothetical protein